MGSIYVIGDIHGWRAKLETLLVDHHLVTDDLAWWAGDSTLIFIGDYVDRGPDGIGTIDLIMRLQKQAVNYGGRVIALLGNHDLMMLAAHFFKDRPHPSFYEDWLYTGGTVHDLKRLKNEHIRWLVSLPAMVKVKDILFLHADAQLYLRYGSSVEEINEMFSGFVNGLDPKEWSMLVNDFAEHRTFYHLAIERVRAFLWLFQAKQLVHGHSPIYKMRDVDPEDVDEPFIYADGLCVNVDHCLYAGGTGFVYKIPEG